jgi:hypothetical protein
LALEIERARIVDLEIGDAGRALAFGAGVDGRRRE